jgi:hypothetical protein
MFSVALEFNWEAYDKYEEVKEKIREDMVAGAALVKDFHAITYYWQNLRCVLSHFARQNRLQSQARDASGV